jgi:hypothetical protein
MAQTGKIKEFFGVKINKLVVANNKLTDDFVGLVTSGLVPNLDRGTPV